ncbi:MAG: hypothetical protein DRP30_03575, partial [Thermotoga sp.]
MTNMTMKIGKMNKDSKGGLGMANENKRASEEHVANLLALMTVVREPVEKTVLSDILSVEETTVEDIVDKMKEMLKCSENKVCFHHEDFKESVKKKNSQEIQNMKRRIIDIILNWDEEVANLSEPTKNYLEEHMLEHVEDFVTDHRIVELEDVKRILETVEKRSRNMKDIEKGLDVILNLMVLRWYKNMKIFKSNVESKFLEMLGKYLEVSGYKELKEKELENIIGMIGKEKIDINYEKFIGLFKYNNLKKILTKWFVVKLIDSYFSKDEKELMEWIKRTEDDYLKRELSTWSYRMGKIAERAPNAEKRSEALRYIASILSSLDVRKSREMFEKAIDSAGEIEDARYRSDALSDIAKNMKELEMKDKNLWERLIDSAGKIESSDALSDIAGNMRKLRMKDKNLWERLIDSAGKIENARYRSYALSSIAENIKEIDIEKSKELFEKAIDSAEEIEDARYRSYALRDIAKNMKELEMKDKNLWEKLIDSAGEIIEVAYDRSYALSDIAENIKEIDVEKSKKLFEKAIDSAGEIKDARFRSRALSDIAKNMKEIDIEKSKKLFEKAIDLAEEIENAEDRSYALSDIAKNMKEIDIEKSKKLFEKAIDSAEEIENAEDRSYAFHYIAENMKESEIRDKNLWERLIDSAGRIKNAEYRSYALRDIAENMKELEMKDKNPWEKLINSAGEIEVEWVRSYALRDIAKNMKELEMKDKNLWEKLIDSAGK